MNQAQGLFVTCIIALVLFLLVVRVQSYFLEQWRKTHSERDRINARHATRLSIILAVVAVYSLGASMYLSLFANPVIWTTPLGHCAP